MAATTTMTPKEKELYELLRDGRVHSREELLKLIGPNSTNPKAALKERVSNTRAKLRPIGYDIRCQILRVGSSLPNNVLFRLVRLTASANDGRS